MTLLNILILLVGVGVILWLVNNITPMDGKIKRILNAVVVIEVVFLLLQVFIILDSLKNKNSNIAYTPSSVHVNSLGE